MVSMPKFEREILLLESITSEFFFKSPISSIHFRMEIEDETWLFKDLPTTEWSGLGMVFASVILQGLEVFVTGTEIDCMCAFGPWLKEYVYLSNWYNFPPAFVLRNLAALHRYFPTSFYNKCSILRKLRSLRQTLLKKLAWSWLSQLPTQAHYNSE